MGSWFWDLLLIVMVTVGSVAWGSITLLIVTILGSAALLGFSQLSGGWLATILILLETAGAATGGVGTPRSARSAALCAALKHRYTCWKSASTSQDQNPTYERPEKSWPLWHVNWMSYLLIRTGTLNLGPMWSATKIHSMGLYDDLHVKFAGRINYRQTWTYDKKYTRSLNLDIFNYLEPWGCVYFVTNWWRFPLGWRHCLVHSASTIPERSFAPGHHVAHSV